MGSGFKTFNSGEILTAADVQNYLQDQAVMVFATATARDAAVTSPEDGMVCYLEDTKFLQVYEDAAWNNLIDSSGVPASGAQKQIVTFTASGTFTKASYPWATNAKITVVGGGGAGGGSEDVGVSGESAGSGGGAGGTAVVQVTTASLAASETVTIGAGGTGVVEANGGNGGTTSFGTIAVATGGTGGIYGQETPGENWAEEGGVGGIGTTGTLLMQGSAGQNAVILSDGMDFVQAGGGGISSFGGSGISGASPRVGNADHQGAAGPVPGAGGDGSAQQDGSGPGAGYAGGDGAAGIVVIELS
jgi:hypothetical protein